MSPDDGIPSALVGSLPSVALDPAPDLRGVGEVLRERRAALPPSVRDPHWRSRKKGPRKRWTRRRFAEYVGVSAKVLVEALKRLPKARRLLGLDADGRWPRTHDHVLSDAAAKKAAKIVVASLARRDRWARRGGYKACIVCGKTTHRHQSKGWCALCYCAKKRRARGLAVKRPNLGAWDPVRGLVACLVCARSSLPHKASGMCNPCAKWHVTQGKHLDERSYVWAVKFKRSWLRAHGRA